MRKILALMLAMAFMTSIAFAEGLKVGAGITFDDCSDTKASVINLLYEQGIGEELTLTVEGDYATGDEQFDLGIEVSYDFAENMTLYFKSFTEMPKGAKVTEWFIPGFQFQHKLDFGDLFYRVDLPIFITGEKVPDYKNPMDLNFTISILRERDPGDDGFGCEIGLENKFLSTTPTEYDGVAKTGLFPQNLSITPYFQRKLLYGELEVGLPIDSDERCIDKGGFSLTPKIELQIPAVEGLSFWLSMPVNGIGAKESEFEEDDIDTVIGFGLGFNLSF